MRVLEIKLENFRGFESFELDFAQGATVLIGPNGVGKSSVLHALWWSIERGVAGLVGPQKIVPADVRTTWDSSSGVTRALATGEPALKVLFDLDGVRFSARLTGDHQQAVVGDTLRSLMRRASGVTLPVLGYVPAARTCQVPAPEALGRSSLLGEAAYAVSSSLSDSLVHVVQWLAEQHYVRLDRLNRALSRGEHVLGRELHPHLRTVERGAACLVDGAETITYDPELRTLMAEIHGERVPLDKLSDGYRNLLAIGLSLAWQAVVLNPHLGADAPQKTPGVVLIDELELHLHPAWQWTVLEQLQRAFPLVQFIVATHSPTVVAAAPPEAVRVLTPTKGLPIEAFGKDVNGVLRDIFGVRVRSEGAQERLRRLDTLLHQGDDDAARTLLSDIEALLGQDDPDVIRARWTLRLRSKLTRENTGS